MSNVQSFSADYSEARDKFLAALEKGLGFCDVILGWDSNDQLIDNLKFTGWHTAYPDAAVRVLPGTLREIPWEPKTAPIDVVERISPRPVLFLHGAEDWLINARHSQELYNKAKEPKKIVIIEKAGHAETMFDQKPDQLMKPCLEWLANTL